MKITLAPGMAGGIIPAQSQATGNVFGMDLQPGKEFAVVADDSLEDGVGENFALSLVERGLCIVVENAEHLSIVEEAVPVPAPVKPAKGSNTVMETTPSVSN